MSGQTPILGIDVGSTTVKAALIDPETGRPILHAYRRHGAEQSQTSEMILRELALQWDGGPVSAVFTGSGGRTLADRAGLGHIQEVVANSVGVQRFHPEARVAIELGGQDAKVIFFHPDPRTGELTASDMRMNGSCAGGTGAFIDEVAKLLQLPVEEFDARAAEAGEVYQISGRCGVFAKTDIQPLLNQGVSRSDIALSTFHALARQTIGGLAQGLEIKPPVIFQGGPLTFNPTLISVFAERLGLTGGQAIRPEQPEIFVAIGAALALPLIFPESSAVTMDEIADRLERGRIEAEERRNTEPKAERFFAGDMERAEFDARHARPDWERRRFEPGASFTAYIGIDAGSTTTKVALIDQDGALLDSGYSSNRGEPLRVGADLLRGILGRYDAEGVNVRIAGLGTTGYGERLFAAAFGADYHTVETVSHATAAQHYVPDASFVLDIGGQDMKAITINGGIVTGITLNEACSAGCGSFLENFADTLKVPVEEIATGAFAATYPSHLGSRCTVFMNSSIITEQKNGKGPNDILAGLCRSIVENVFTKVVRVPNFEMLGNQVVVQGGTFENDAVLRALEQYTGRQVFRAPFPGLMGAIGIAMLTRDAQKNSGVEETRFGGLAALDHFDYVQESGHVCPYCSNACNRTIVRFADGSHFVTGNRCERGEIIEPPDGEGVRDRIRAITAQRDAVPNLFVERERLLFRKIEVPELAPDRGLRIGIPRALEFWNSYPFWYAFWTSLGYEVVLSSRSTKELFERGLASVPSDTVCFPAKIAHGHLHDLIDRKVDRIFMPMINRMPPENTSTTSDHVCAVVKGYPMVLAVSDEPDRRHGIPFDRPMFHWVDGRARRKQITRWAADTFDIDESVVVEAITVGDRALDDFRRDLENRGREVIESVEGSDRFVVVLSGRPYHSDRLVNHELADQFIGMGIPVLTADSLPNLNTTDLSRTRAELTINFHVRMYSAALRVAEHPNLELVQIVSFGCGHDAIITDEVIRLMEESSEKTPLTLKLDETDVSGPLAIRIRSFIETVRTRRSREGMFGVATVDADGSRSDASERLPDPFPIKFRKADRKTRVIMAPNVSEAFAHVISAVIRAEGYRIEPLPLADARAIELGKRYIHNDMCFPAQVNVGEMLRALESGHIDRSEAVLGLAKSQCDCRLANYATLARKALDDAGYGEVPIITTDIDTKNMHPGFSLSPIFELRMLWALAMVDALEDLRRRLRPYEAERGSIDLAFEEGMLQLAAAMERSIKAAFTAYRHAVTLISAVELTDEPRRPRVFVIGEFLLNFHPTSNFNIERYLEDNGMEVVLPNILDSFRRDFMRMKTERQEFFVRYPIFETAIAGISDRLFDHVLEKVATVARTNPYYEQRVPLPEIARFSEEIVHHTFTSGEGWMIAGEILHHAAHGIRSFLILQPFGCLPNHVTGRGLVKRLKEIHPDAQILSLDYDPDTSFANIENRLQMLILNSRMNAVATGS